MFSVAAKCFQRVASCSVKTSSTWCVLSVAQCLTGILPCVGASESKSVRKEGSCSITSPVLFFSVSLQSLTTVNAPPHLPESAKVQSPP